MFRHFCGDLHLSCLTLAGSLLLQSTPVHGDNALDAEMPVFKPDPADLSVEISHSRYIDVYIIVVIPAEFPRQRDRYLGNHLIFPGLLRAEGDTLHGKLPGIFVVYVISVKAQNIHRLLIRSGNHPVGKPHGSVFLHLKDSRGCIRLYQAVIHHVTADRHQDLIGARLRKFRRKFRRLLLFRLQIQGVPHRRLNPVGRVGGAGYHVHILNSLRVLIGKSHNAGGHALCCLGEFSPVHFPIGSAEMIPGNLKPCNGALCHRHFRMNVVFPELVDVKRTVSGIGAGGLGFGRRFRRRGIPEQPQRQQRRQKSRAPFFFCFSRVHMILLQDGRNPRGRRAGGFPLCSMIDTGRASRCLLFSPPYR